MQRDPEGEQQREQPEDREDQEERRDERVAGHLLAARSAAGPGAGPELGRCRAGAPVSVLTWLLPGWESGRPAGPACRGGRTRRPSHGTRSRTRGQPAAASASLTAVAQPSSARLLAVLDAAHRVLDRVAHRLVLRAEVDRLEAAGTGHEELADRGVAEVLVGRRPSSSGVVVERRVGRQVADLLERRQLAVGAGQEVDQLDGQVLVLADGRDRRGTSRPSCRRRRARWRCPTCRRSRRRPAP